MPMKRDGRKGGRWSYTAGYYPYSVRVYERASGAIYAAVYDPDAREGRGGERRRSLSHNDRVKARRYADKLAVELPGRVAGFGADASTVDRVFRLYRKHCTPSKGAASRQEDERQAELWRRFLGARFDLSHLSRREWDMFARQRKSGAIDPRGNRVGERERRPVGARVVQKDLAGLRAVCRWATEYGEGGKYLLDGNPTRGLSLPREKNPKRPVASHDRADAVRQKYREPIMRVVCLGRRERAETYLPEIFEIVVGTGRRITPVCRLRTEDLALEPTDGAPWGAIVWPEDTDKMEKRWRCPISPAVADALAAALKKRRAVGPGWLFPSPSDPERPLRYEAASEWLCKAEELAELEPQEGSLWHAYRRLWASSRKDLPDIDVAQAGGWSSLDALKTAYQRPDDATMLRVVTHQAELREVKRV